jgi:hypothetical protein
MNEELNVKTGDEVLVSSRWRKEIVTVTNVTPKGFIRTSDGGYYDSYGRIKSSDPWDGSSISILTEEMRKSFLEEKYIRATLVMLNDLKRLTYEQAVQIREILNR